MLGEIPIAIYDFGIQIKSGDTTKRGQLVVMNIMNFTMRDWQIPSYIAIIFRWMNSTV